MAPVQTLGGRKVGFEVVVGKFSVARDCRRPVQGYKADGRDAGRCWGCVWVWNLL